MKASCIAFILICKTKIIYINKSTVAIFKEQNYDEYQFNQEEHNLLF